MVSYKEMGGVDLKLKLLRGKDISVDNLLIPQYTIGEIEEYSYTHYMRNLQWLSLTVDDFIDSVTDLEKRVQLQVEKSNLKSFDFFTKLGGEETLEVFLSALAMIFKTEDVFFLHDKNAVALNFLKMGVFIEADDGRVVPNENLESIEEENLQIITRDNFDEIVEVVKIINYISPPKDEKKEFNPADEATRELLEQMERNRKKVEEIKNRQRKQDNEDEDKIDISDIVSAVSVKSNSTNKYNVWDLTLYQLYNEYARLEVIDNYDFSIKAMLAGAEKVDIKHWSSRL